MNNVFNLNEGEILILKETNYDDFIKNGNKIVINKPNINPVYKNLTNKEIPIKLVEGSYDSKKLTDNKIYNPSFQTLILGPMTKIEISYADSRVSSSSHGRSENKVSSTVVLSNLSKNTTSNYSTEQIYLTDLGNSIMSIKVINQSKNPNANNEHIEHNKWIKKLEDEGSSFEILDKDSIKEKPCMRLDLFILYLFLFSVIVSFLFILYRKLYKN